MERKVYVNLKTPVDTGGSSIHNELRVVVDYQKGGFNCFTGEYSNNGVYAFLTPVSRGNGFESFSITGSMHVNGYKILLKEIGRKSQKQIDLMAEKVLPHATQIADLYSDAKHKEIYDLITKL